MKSNYVDKIADGSVVKILDFSLCSADDEMHRLGINIQKIREIVEYQNIQPLPETYFPFVGVYNLRNIPVPVVSLEYFFFPKNKSEIARDMKILICEFQLMLIGFVVSKTGRILTVKNSEIQPVPPALDFSSKRLFNGILKQSNGFINLLDIELILDSLKVNLGQNQTHALSPNFKGKRILLVEDSKLFQAKLKSFFDKMGVDLIIANDGIEGLKKLEECNYKVDIIFTDIEMPRMNGIGMVRKIKLMPEAKKIPVIFNTSISNQGLVDDISREQLGDYFVKYNEDEIHQTITEILKKVS